MRTLRILTMACGLLLGSQLCAEQQPPNVPPEMRPRAEEAKKLFSEGDFAGAEKIYNEMLKAAPENVYLLSNLGVTLFREGKYKLSEEAFLKAREIDPTDGFTHCTLGILHYSQGKYDAAIADLKKALAINPNDATARNYLGITLSQKGSQVVAEKELEAAVTIDPKYADALFNLAVVLATENPPKKEEARKYYQRAIDLGAERDPALEQLMKDGPAENEPLHDMTPRVQLPPRDRVLMINRASTGFGDYYTPLELERWRKFQQVP